MSKKVLLVDDDEDDQLFFCEAIKKIGDEIKCNIVDNGLKALTYLSETPSPPDMIFLDLNMPIMNGIECLREIKQEEKYKDIPVIIYSTSKSQRDIDLTRELGAELFFTKPSDLKMLYSKLSKLIADGPASHDFII